MTDQHLVWIDLEMTGLDPNKEKIIEIATVVTNSQLDLIAQGPVIAVKQPDEYLDNMDAWNRKTHGKSGLTERVKASTITEHMAEQMTLDFLNTHVKPGTSPMCGNTIWQDRRFLERGMPNLANFFHYRMLDVSTLKELAKRWAPKIYNGVTKENNHTALADILESVEELKYYRSHFLKLDDITTDDS